MFSQTEEIFQVDQVETRLPGRKKITLSRRNTIVLRPKNHKCFREDGLRVFACRIMAGAHDSQARRESD